MLYTPSTHTTTEILQQAAVRPLTQPTCCCLRQTCAAQQQNKQLMTLLEDELALAAQLGQRILLQHDEYVIKADTERRALLLDIDRQRGIQERAEALEQGNRLLERQNHSVMDENLALMKRLEQLHAQLNSAESRNQDLLATLADAEQANDSLSSKARAAQTLKQQVSSIQLEKEALEQQVQSLAHDQEGSAARFGKAQRKIDELQETLQTLSQPANTPQSTRQALRTPTRRRSRSPLATSTASTKLTDLFEENATLASSAAELRRLLAASQEELAALRQEPITALTNIARPSSPTLRQTMSQELHHHHYHHYYHVPDKTGKKRSSSTRLRRLASPETEYATPAPVSRVAEHGLASPISLQKQAAPTRRGPRDSGYFSVSRDRSSSYSHPSTPLDLPSTTDDESERDLARTPTRFRQRACSVHTVSGATTPYIPHGRSNSVDSILPQDLRYSEAPITLQQDLMGRLQHSTSHESLLPSLITSDVTVMSEVRRPKPSPLQAVDSPVTSTLSADLITARGFGYRRGQSSPRAGMGSYSALLRTAAAAQRQTSGTGSTGANPTGKQAPGVTSFWRRSSSGAGSGATVVSSPAVLQIGKAVPVGTLPGTTTAGASRQRSAKWLEKLWQGAMPLPVSQSPIVAVESEPAVLEPVHVDEDLLKEALGLV